MKTSNMFPIIGPMIVIFLIVNSILIYGIQKVTNENTLVKRQIIKDTIEELGEPDLTHICKLTTCESIEINDNRYLMTPDRFLKSTDIEEPDLVYKFENYSIVAGQKIKIPYDLGKEGCLSIILDKTKQIDEINSMILLINIFVQTLYGFFLLFLYYLKRKRLFLDRLQLSNSIQEKNMKILTENIHHEINTPLAIITGTIEQQEYSRKIYLDYTKRDADKRNKREERFLHQNSIDLDYDTLYASIDQINNIMQRMNGFKQIKYSNGNKTIKDIIDYSINSMTIYKQGNFDYKIGNIFNDYSLSGDMENGDFLNILSNFLRNSLEAGSDFIDLNGVYKNGKFHMYIVDNGEGIFNKTTGKHIKRKNYNNVFDSYYSTKDSNGNKNIIEKTKLQLFATDFKCFFKKTKLQLFATDFKCFFKKTVAKNTETRGVGLYLNKQLILSKGGDIFLKSTDATGTVFELIFDAKEKRIEN